MPQLIDSLIVIIKRNDCNLIVIDCGQATNTRGRYLTLNAIRADNTDLIHSLITMSFAQAVQDRAPHASGGAHGNEPLEFISTGGNDRAVVEYLNALFPRAAREGVSDIHFEDDGDHCFIRFRNRGVLEIAVNEDTACYYVPGNGELVKSIALSGEMEAELFLIR